MLDSSDGALVRRLVVQLRTISMALTLADVDHVATLARLGLTEAERERMREQLSTILEHIGELSGLDTESIPPTASVTQTTNVWREDTVRPSLTHEQVFQNAPRVSNDCFVVRTPLGGEGDEA
jgi:aspartyl-tRNA(Asn)/glutamyl-tRNA(Gln) amidotransferase subunit C